ncbi:acVLRF1 family peptidyl-tRNA hydrolase [Phytoactinopolyspora halotolerans]|uniref:Actinobacteria/chloroflexi VLRF1 release factor domain-containing protein n=1 Tax=Phytoactinopolyspora halotolerans TaxID=1981512 RepID=A0A6L9S222_9ACTN|nr:acVLRF1 family peptidyl-tRNA hydrolase [Phytoactinopolyspora halotolerans]NED98641.1 hypothetical protein [Phytoactinopolyspora halotolerans]
MPTKRIAVAPERLERWLAGFADRHGAVEYRATADSVIVDAEDGAQARCDVPFPPLDVDPDAAYGGLLAHAWQDRRVGVLLVRKGGHAAGVFVGRELVASKVGSRHVQGRSAAGGQSQQRFARRREKQAREAYQAAADVAVRVLMPHAATLDAVVTGGDRGAATRVLADARLSPLHGLLVSRHVAVPDPKLSVLRDTPDVFRAVPITIDEPDT